MKKIISIFVLFMTVISNTTVANATDFWAKNYIVMEKDTKQVVEGKNINETQSVASISKIMTAIVVIENCDLEEVITITEEMIALAWGSGIYVHPGDEISIQDLLYGLMLRSGNDAAAALATHAGGGDFDMFVTMMNQKAQELSMENTLFRNPSGLDEEDGGNISSVYDMALLMAYCLDNETFREITSTQSYQRIDGKGTWKNKNKLLQLYEYTTSGKTGYTKIAKRTLISSAKKNNVELIVVTFNCGDDFAFHKSLYEQYFALYEQTLLLNKGIHQIDSYYFTVEDQVMYPLKQSDSQYSLYYEIIESEAIVNVYLKYNNQLTYLRTYRLHDKKISWFYKVLNGETL